MCDDEDDDNAALAKALADVRKVGGGLRFISREGKDTNECWDAVNALRALGLPYTDFQHRKDDPPDCQATVNGELWGIEVTELLDVSRRDRQWTRQDFLSALQKIIIRKDNPADLRGGPYPQYLLVVWTREMHLDRGTLERFLAGTVFNCALITHACVGLDYHPGFEADDPEAYPAVPIAIRHGPEHKPGISGANI